MKCNYCDSTNIGVTYEFNGRFSDEYDYCHDCQRIVYRSDMARKTLSIHLKQQNIPGFVSVGNLEHLGQLWIWAEQTNNAYPNNWEGIPVVIKKPWDGKGDPPPLGTMPSSP